MTEPASLSANTVPPPAAETVNDAVVATMEPERDLACGVFRADGSFCDLSRTLISVGRLTGRPDRPEPEREFPGRYLFAGIGRHHFGHFLLEGIPRLWALEEVAPVDGILLVPMHGVDFGAVMRRRLGAFMDLLTGGLPVHNIREPVRVEQLVVPSQGMGHRAWITGTPPFRRFVRERLCRKIEPQGPERLYISRSLLKREDQMVDQEDRIEAIMKRAGYTVFHPQKHPIPKQCARYMAARRIVGADGSAFHLAPFVLQPECRVAIFQRRHRRQRIVEALASQMRAFADVEALTIDALCPPAATDACGDRPNRLDIGKLERDLSEAGFL